VVVCRETSLVRPRKGAMTHLVEALHALGLEGEIALSDHWVKLQGERCAVYVAEASWGRGYYTWCDDPHARAVEFYHDPVAAIFAGLRRAANADTERDAK
jgi:hypothetical protein